MNNTFHAIILRAFIFSLALVADRVTKKIAVSSLETAGNDPALFSLGLHFNRGVSFSLFADHPTAAIALAALGLTALLFVYSRTSLLRRARGVSLLAAGAVGNLIDRAVYGYVVDWLYVGVHINLADIWLCLGALLLVLDMRRRDRL